MKAHALPALFLERLSFIVPDEMQSQVTATFSRVETPVFRVNTLRWSVRDAENFMASRGITLTAVPGVPAAYHVPVAAKEILRGCVPLEEGRFYWQDVSSQLPALVLTPLGGEKLLDLCAAPGSKTTQMAALMNGQGEITAVEVVRDRFFRLRAVCALLGAACVKTVLLDGRRFKARSHLFDKILVDVPCSSEGRFNTHDPDSFAYWSPRKIKEMVQKQRGLLLNAGRALVPGGTMVYSTCSFAPEENEGVVDWFLRKAGQEMTLEAFDLPGVPRYPALTGWHGRPFRHDLSACTRVLPDGLFTGFFIAKFRKIDPGRV